MTKKRPQLPSSGGSYVRKGTDLKQVQEPTRELTRREMQQSQATTAKDAASPSKQETDK